MFVSRINNSISLETELKEERKKLGIPKGSKNKNRKQGFSRRLSRPAHLSSFTFLTLQLQAQWSFFFFFKGGLKENIVNIIMISLHSEK